MFITGIAHEAPKSIFDTIQNLTDYDYCLAHLYDEDEEYRDLFLGCKSLNRQVLLDNSIFELGEAFDGEDYARIILDLQPDEYIIPDVLDKGYETIDSASKFLRDFKDLPDSIVKIGVVQGEDYNSLVDCYKYMSEHVDKIAISFNSEFLRQEVTEPSDNKYFDFSKARPKLIDRLINDGIINTNKPHHFLGNSLPQEGFAYHNSKYNFIASVDTSNPVIHGLKYINYDGHRGLDKKEEQMLFTLINAEVNNDQLAYIKYNCEQFRMMWRTNYDRKF